MHRRLVLNRKNISKIIVALTCLLPIVTYYNFPGTGISSEIILYLLIALCAGLLNRFMLFDANIHTYFTGKKYFLFFTIWFILISLFYEIGTNYGMNSSTIGTINTYLQVCSVGFCIYIFFKLGVEFEAVEKIYTIYVYVILCIFFLQVALFIAGVKVNFKLPFHSYSSSWDYLNNTNFGMSPYPRSLFSEKAHLCEYTAPFVVIKLFKRNRNTKDFAMAIIVTAIILSTISGNGIVTVGIIWLYYFVSFPSKGFKKIIITLLGLALMISAFLYLSRLPIYEATMNRLFINRTVSGNTDTKADYRVYRGFDYYFQLPITQKIIGVGFRHVQSFASINSLSSRYDSSRNLFEWFSTITQILLYSGIVGMSFFSAFILKISKFGNQLTKALLLMATALWFSTQMLFSSTFMLYMILIASSVFLIREEGI